ncbi:MarR family winged helix-turn-helix transcriptional regulator [Sphingomonas tagetis]|nr:MarR family transcriptional regulator [Sphingomonas tagetis]
MDALRTIARLTLRMHAAIGGQLGRELFSAPALDMLLDLYVQEDRQPISLTSLCGAASVPPRTALNTINRMVERGLLDRSPDPDDGRRVHIRLSTAGIELLDACCADLRAILWQDRWR